jgi:hypothetical protein
MLTRVDLFLFFYLILSFHIKLAEILATLIFVFCKIVFFQVILIIIFIWYIWYNFSYHLIKTKPQFT